MMVAEAAGPRVARSSETMIPKHKHPLCSGVFVCGDHCLARTTAAGRRPAACAAGRCAMFGLGEADQIMKLFLESVPFSVSPCLRVSVLKLVPRPPSPPSHATNATDATYTYRNQLSGRSALTRAYQRHNG